MSMPPHKRARLNSGAPTAAGSDEAADAQPPSPLASDIPSAAPAAPPHTRLHRHALESIVAFLSFREIRSVMFVSRDWLAAVYSMRGVGHTLGRPERVPGGLQPLLRSRLARHIGAIGWYGNPLRVSPALLRQVCAAIPYLRRLVSLVCIPLNGEEWRGAFRLPSTLTDLTLCLPQHMSNLTITELLAQVAMHAGIRDMSLFLVADRSVERRAAGINFTPLAAMPALRVLAIWLAGNLSDEQVTQLRSLTQLTRLEVTPRPHLLLSRLLAPGHQLGWTELGDGMVVDDVSAPLLASLPHLSTLCAAECEGALMEVSRFDWLVPLTQLTRLELDLSLFNTQLQRTLLTLPLHFPLLTSFYLKDIPCKCAELGSLLSRMPRVEMLRLSSLRQLESLAFLQQEPLRSTLHTLELVRCRHRDLASSELSHLHGMQLTSLALLYSLPSPLDDLQYHALTPPSLELPQLVLFEYEDPEDDQYPDRDHEE